MKDKIIDSWFQGLPGYLLAGKDAEYRLMRPGMDRL